MGHIFRLICVLGCLMLLNTLQAQGIDQFNDTTKVYRVELNDGSVFFGTIIARDTEKLVLKTKVMPRVELSHRDIKRMTEVKTTEYKKGKYWFANPHTSRYLYSPSGFNLKKGEGYYQNTNLILNSFNVGVTDNITVGGGIELISTFVTLAFGEFQPIFFLTTKASVKIEDNLHIGGGALYVNMPFYEYNQTSRTGSGIAYGIATYGNPDHNITAGLGWGFVQSEFSESPIITISGTSRFSERFAFISENWFIPVDGYYALYSYGVRFIAESIAVDLAFINNPDIAEFIIIGLPFVSFTVKF
ncbi:MAG: hypothetical protein LAT54_06570 [Cryomorphaceae bacterium]|nr:hypothetical protein [Cryomorphaceae bacterium]